jgi:uncharacterized membrane protein
MMGFFNVKEKFYIFHVLVLMGSSWAVELSASAHDEVAIRGIKLSAQFSFLILISNAYNRLCLQPYSPAPS